MKSRFGFLVLLALVVSSVFSAAVLPVQTAYAEDANKFPWISSDIESIARKYAAQEVLLSCTLKAGANAGQKIQRDTARNSGETVFSTDTLRGSNTETVIGYALNGGGNDGVVNCTGSNGSIENQLGNILKELGWTSSGEMTAVDNFLCEVSTNSAVGSSAHASCLGSTSQFDRLDYNRVLAAIKRHNPGILPNVSGGTKAGQEYPMSGPVRYVSGWNTLQKKCQLSDPIKVKPNKHDESVDGKAVYTSGRLVVNRVNADGSIEPVSYKYVGSSDPLYIYSLSDKRGSNGAQGHAPNNCVGVATDMNSVADAYSSYIKDHRGKAAQGQATNPTGNAEISTGGSGGDGEEPVCVGGALGWILCPVAEIAKEAMRMLTNAIDGYMRFDPLMGTTQGDAVFRVWRIVVNIANIALVVAFMVVIFSQATSLGLSAYGIKKMLPRIIAAAILINISFYLCAILVDIFNVVGASLGGIIDSVTKTISTPSFMDTSGSGAGSFIWGLISIVLGVGVLATTGTIAFVLPMALSAAASLGILFIILALRHTLALMLIMISPLAFAAMILPNTDSMFKKWWKALWTTLALYPIMMALAHGSMLVSKIMLTTVKTDSSGNPAGIENLLIVVMALIVTVAWVFALKFIMSWGSGFAGKIAGMVNDKNKGFIDRARNWAGQKQKNSTFSQALSHRRDAINTNAQRRGYTRMGGRFGKIMEATMSKDARQIFGTQIEDANDKLHDQRVRYALSSGIRRAYDPKDRSLDSENGIVGLAAAAQAAAASKDQVTFDAIASHAASGGADEFKYFYEILQGNPKGNFASIGDKYKVNNKKVFDSSLGYLNVTKSGELAPKNPSVANILRQADSSKDIDAEMEREDMKTMYKKVGADKHAQYSSDQAKVAAKYATAEVVKELIENPGGKHSLGSSAQQAYQAAYDALPDSQKTPGGGRKGPTPPNAQPPASSATSTTPTAPAAPRTTTNPGGPNAGTWEQNDSGLFIPRDR